MARIWRCAALEAPAPIRPLAWEPPYDVGAALKKNCGEHTYIFAHMCDTFLEIQNDSPRMVLNISRAFEIYFQSVLQQADTKNSPCGSAG